MALEVSTKIAKFAHDYRSRLLQEQGKDAAKMTKYDVAKFMRDNGALSETEFKSWVENTKEGREALQLTNQQKEAIKRGSIMTLAPGLQSYLDSDEVCDFTLGNVLGFEKTTNEETGKTDIKSKAVSRQQYKVAEEMKKQSFMNRIKSLPTPQATYTELMRSIEFDRLDNEGKMEMMLKISGEKFNEAKKKGDKQAMKDYLLEGLGMAIQLGCQKIDSTIGIKQFKEWAKERSGLNFLVDLVDKYVDDGDEATLSWLEKNWEGVKGFGDALDSFLGSQAIGFIASLELLGMGAAGLASVTGVESIGTVFSALTKGYFLYDGGKMMVEGTVGYYNAETKADARVAGQQFGMGSFIFLGTLKSVIGDIKAYRASHAVPEGQGGLPELSEGHKAILEENLPSVQDKAQITSDLAFLQQNGIEIVDFRPGHGVNSTESSFVIKYNGKTIDVTNDVYGLYDFGTAVSQLAQHIKGEAPKVWSEVDAVTMPKPNEIIAAAEAKVATTEVSDAGGLTEFSVGKDAQGNVVKTTIKQGPIERNTYVDGGKTVDQTTIDGKVIGSYVHDGKNGVYVDAKGKQITEEAFSDALTKATTEAYNKSIAKQYQTMEPSQLREIAKTPEGVKALEDAGVVVSKANASSFNGKVHEGQSSSPARQMRKLDLSGTPEEACARNTDVGLKYDASRVNENNTGFYLEVSWDGGKTIETMDVPNDPLGNFVVNYGTEAWNHAHIGGTEAKASYVEPKAYNADGTKIPVEPESLGTEWFEASKAAPVRFMEVPEGVKGVVGKEGFQPITTPTQVIAFDVKGQAYINEARYFLENSKGLSTETVETLYKIDPSLRPAESAKPYTTPEMKEVSVKPEGDVMSAPPQVQSNPASYRERLQTPDYTHTRENFPADAHQSHTAPGAAKAYTTDGKPDGIVYRDPADGKLKVPNKWDPEKPYEVSDGSNGEPASVIMIYDEADGNFAVGDPTTIAKTYKNPATGEVDPLYDRPLGKENALDIEKDIVPSAYKIVEPGTEIMTKEGPRVVQEGEVVVYDVDGDPYVMPLKEFLKRHRPVGEDSQGVYQQLQAVQKGEATMPSELVAKDGNATSPNAKTYVKPVSEKTPMAKALMSEEGHSALAERGINVTDIQESAPFSKSNPDRIITYEKDGKMYELTIENERGFTVYDSPLKSDNVHKLVLDFLDGKEVKDIKFDLKVKSDSKPVPSMVVTRANGTQVDVLKDISQETLSSPTSDHLRLPDATTVKPEFGVKITQQESAPVEARRIVFADTVEETLRINNEHGIPLKYEANPPEGEAPYFYKDAPYGGRQKVNTQSVEVTYTHEAIADWGLTKEYVAEYADANGMCPDRAVVAAGNDPVTGLKGNIAEKQYEVVNPDGSRSPLVVSNLAPGQTVQIGKKGGVELKMAVFDEPTTSLEGETLPAGKLMMIDSEGHPYNGNPVKRLKSGEVKMNWDESDPVQAQINSYIQGAARAEQNAKIANKEAGKLDKQVQELRAKAEEASNNGDANALDLNTEADELSMKASELKIKADGFKAEAKEFTAKAEAELTEWVKANQGPAEPTGGKPAESAKSENLKFGKYDEARQEELVQYIWREDRGEGDYRVKGSDGYFSDAESAWAEADRLYPAKAPEASQEVTGKKTYEKPEMKEVSAKAEGDVMAASTVKSSDFLSTTNRVLHPRNYARAQELQSKGIEVEFDPNSRKARISVDIPENVDVQVLQSVPHVEVKQGAGVYNFYKEGLNSYKETAIYKFKGVENGKAVFEIPANDVTEALQSTLEISNGKLTVSDYHGNTEPRWTFEQSMQHLESAAKSNFRSYLSENVPDALKSEASDLAYQMKPGEVYEYKDVSFSPSQKVKVDLLEKHGIKVDFDVQEDQYSGTNKWTTEIRFTKDGGTTTVERTVRYRSTRQAGMDEAFDEVLDAKLKEVEYEVNKEKAAKADEKAAQKVAKYEAEQAKLAGIQARIADADALAAPRMKSAEASGVKDSSSEEYAYYVATGRGEGYDSTAPKTITTYNDGTVKTNYSAHYAVTRFPDGSFDLKDRGRHAFRVTYDPNGKLSITDGNTNSSFDYTIDVDARILKEAGINPADFNAISSSYEIVDARILKEAGINPADFNAIRSSYEIVADLYNGAAKAVVQKAKADLSNIEARLEKDPAFINLPQLQYLELKHSVDEMLGKLPEIEDMVTRKVSANAYQKDILELQRVTDQITRFTSKIDRNNLSVSSSNKIMAEVTVPLENMRAVDRQILSDLAGIYKMLGDNSKIFYDRPGFRKDYTDLKDMVVQEINSKGNAKAIETYVKDNIAKLRNDMQKMVDALGDK